MNWSITKKQPSEFSPTKDELKTAQRLVRFMARDGRTLSVEQCKEVVEFLSDDMHRETADWKNATLFHITGIGAVCTYRDE